LRIGSRRSDRRASAPDVFKRGGEANISGKAHRKSPQNRSKVTQSGHWMFCRMLGLEGRESFRERGWSCYASLTR